MPAASWTGSPSLTSDEVAALRRKVAWRIIPLVVLLYLVAYLDRANVGFAKLRMGQDLGFCPLRIRRHDLVHAVQKIPPP